MHRLSRDAMSKRLRVGIAVLRPYQKRAVGSLDAVARDEVVEAMVTQLMGPERSEALILEPHPHPDLPVAHD